MRLVDIDRLPKGFVGGGDFVEGIKYVYEMLKLLPTVDAVEVVRCKDCAYANEDGTRCHYGVGRDTEPMGYCHKGAKMDGKGEG